MTRKNKGKNTSASGPPAPASTDLPSQEPPPQSNPDTQTASSSVLSDSCIVSAESHTNVSVKETSGYKALTESSSTILSSMKSVAITSPAAADDLVDSEGNIDQVNVVTKSDTDILKASGTSDDPGPSGASGTSDDPGPSGTSDDPGPSGASGTSCDPGPSDKKKRDPLSSPESSHDASSLKKRKCSREESLCFQILTPTEPAEPERSINDVVSNIRYVVSTPDGDYSFYGPRRQLTVINLKTSEVVNEPSTIRLEDLPPNYVMLAQQSEDSFFVTEYRSNFPNWEEPAYMEHQIRHLYYISEEKTRLCASAADASRPLPDNIEIGIRRALEEAVNKIRDYLVYQTRCEEENVFNQEFYCSRNENGYKPPFSNTEMFKQIPASESVMKLAILLLALADAAMDNVRLVAGIGYCYVAHRMINGFRILSLLQLPYKVLDHFIRQKVSTAVYALELYTKKDCGVDEKPYDEVCACFNEITTTLLTMTAKQATWQRHLLLHDPIPAELPFLEFIEEIVKPRTQWTMDSRLSWTTEIISAIRTARRMVAILADVESHEKTTGAALFILKKHYKTLRDFKLDHNERESKHVETLVARFRSLSLSPLLECIKDHKEADKIATQISEDLAFAIEAEINSEPLKFSYMEQLLEDRIVYTLFRLFYHMWETQKPKHVTMIRLKLLGICEAALAFLKRNGDCGNFRALVALSSIMYLDYTCGMVSKASETSIKKARKRCHGLAEDHLAGNEQCKQMCLNLLTLKMEEIQRSIFGEDKETEEYHFEVCCRILKIATLAYPVLSYFGKIPSVDKVKFPEVADPADESYWSKTRKLRPPQNGQKLLYLSVPDNMNRNYRAAQFLKLGDKTDETKSMIGAASADPDDALGSDSDEDDTEDEEKPSTEEEQGNSLLFLSTFMPLAQRDSPDSFLTTKPLPTRETIADALEKFKRPSEAVAVMLEPLRSDSLRADDDSVERSESETYVSESSDSKPDQTRRIKALQKMEEFKPIDLKQFYNEISNDKITFPFEVSKLEEVFAKTIIPISTGEVEENFLESLRIVLRLLLVSVNKMLARYRGDFDQLRRQHWKKWLERIVLLSNLLKERRLTLREYQCLHQVMYSYCVILGFPIRIFTNSDTC